MDEVEYCHEIDEFENKPLVDEIFSFNSEKMNISEVNKIHKIGNCNVFLPLNEEEMKIFAKNGIDGDFLRKIGDNQYVNTFFEVTYSINEKGTISKTFKY